MSADLTQFSRTMQVASKTVFEAFKVLKEAGGELRGKEVIDQISKNLIFNEWESGIYEKTGYIRWQSILHFYTIDCIKAGYMRKQKGVWLLTKEGEDAMKKGPAELLISASEKYKTWAVSNKKEKVDDIEVSDELPDTARIQKANIEQLEEKAIEEIRGYIAGKNPYEFQDMVAALLEAMGYYISFVSPKGKDGGLDVIAYQDPLGLKIPKIKVQVKHRMDATIPVSDIRSLIGILNKDGDIGLFVTSGKFSSETEKSARESNIHVELVDFEKFVSLWREHYNKLSDENKNMLPLHPIYFLGSNE